MLVLSLVEVASISGDIASHLCCREWCLLKQGWGTLQSPVPALRIHKCKQHDGKCYGLFEACPQRDNCGLKPATGG